MTTERANPNESIDQAASSTADPAIAALSFDEAFAELRAAVTELEAGGLSLEETIARTERAVALQRHCERLLGDAELRVKQLVSRPGGGLEAREIVVDEASEGAER
jgi:exodeoxyribonuclease VII small subunit